MKLGILNADIVNPKFSPVFGEYPDMFAKMFKAADLDVELVTYQVIDGEFPELLDEVDAYLITGSKFSVYDDVPWIHKLKAFVKKLHENKKKLVGICFGHQMVAEALEGNVSKAGSGWSVGVQSNSLNEASQHYGFQQNDFLLCSNHQDQGDYPKFGRMLVTHNMYKLAQQIICACVRRFKCPHAYLIA